MTRKRVNGEGSISRHPKRDLWMARYTVETPAGTKRRTVYGKTRREVRDKLAKALAERADGFLFDDENITVGEYVTRWLEDSAKGGLAHRTYANYKLQVRRHIVPALGRVKLAKLNPVHVQGLYAAKLHEGLKPSSVRYMHSVLRRSLEQAVRWNLIPRNPAALVDPPKVVGVRVGVQGPQRSCWGLSHFAIILQMKAKRRTDERARTADLESHYECAGRRCWGVHSLANAAFLGGFLCCGLQCIAPY